MSFAHAKKAVLAASLVLVSASAAEAVPELVAEVCLMTMQRVPTEFEGSSQALSYMAKLEAECEISEKYQQMKFKAEKKWSLNLEQISEYQAMRYIRRADFERAKSSDTPVSKIYQISYSQYDLPVEQKSTIIWDNFMKGISQLESERARISAGGLFSLDALKRYHVGFYQLSEEYDKSVTRSGRHANEPKPGVIKSPSPNDASWWKLKVDEVESTKAIVDDVNRQFVALGLLPSLQAQSFEVMDSYRYHVLDVRPTLDRSGFAVYSGDTRAHVEQLGKLTEFLNQTLSQARKGRHMVWNKRLLTPAEVAFTAQQFFVDIHPFYEGNGRLSRLIQEIVLTAFSLPHGSSGDLLQDDVMTPPDQYYRRAIDKMKSLLGSVDQCLETVYPEAVAPKSSSGGSKRETKTQVATRSLFSVPPQEISYECRLLN